ncbi:uncharacterized protein LOC117779548 [Drosophila innubila]|uniref:uncharacterized protein LOC117779548 n=1 Tax=Drosophila innubila TaxID=198719 RepID=UPI00148C22BD|nr:uncharacterized protein LOC117779548 [Drosophila innubila]
MDCGNEMHQQFLKDFIQSLQAGSDDSYSLSESSLNPNAAEFVPSYLKSEDEECAPYEDNCQAKVATDEVTTSTTTLVRQEIVGDNLHISQLDAQSRIQRQLFNMMDQLGSHNFPLSAIQFNLSSDAQGINVQFMMPGGASRPLWDDNLCLASGLRVEIGNHETRPGNALAAQFLSRMCAALNGKSQQTKEPSICPRCTALPKKHSYTELEIERQIEDIKAFEKLINNDGGTRYQEAFKELCHKLGLATPEEQLVNSGISAAPMPIKTNDSELITKDHDICYNEDEELSGYDWDSFTPEFNHMKVYRLTDVNESDMIREADEEQLSSKEDFELNVPPSTPAMSTTKTNVSSVFPKLYKVAQKKCINNARKTAIHKEKESKLQRCRITSPSRGVVPSGPTSKKQSEPLCVTGNRPKTHVRELPPKSGVVRNHIPDMADSQILKSNCKIEASSRVKNQQTSEQVHVNKHSKAATLPRATGNTGAGQMQSTKQSQAGAVPRVVAPRMTQASKMRQSEVKRRLSLMRGEDTDVQFNEYLFK